MKQLQRHSQATRANALPVGKHVDADGKVHASPVFEEGLEEEENFFLNPAKKRWSRDAAEARERIGKKSASR